MKTGFDAVFQTRRWHGILDAEAVVRACPSGEYGRTFCGRDGRCREISGPCAEARTSRVSPNIADGHHAAFEFHYYPR